MQLQNLKQDDLTVTQFLQEAKLLSDELVAAGRTLSASDFNICVFKGLCPDIKDIVTTLSARSDPVSYSELHSLLLNHEFIHSSSMSSLSLVSGDNSNAPSANVAQHVFSNDKQSPGQSNNTSHRGRGRSYRGRGERGGRNQYPRNNYGTKYSTQPEIMMDVRDVKFAMALIISCLLAFSAIITQSIHLPISLIRHQSR